MAGRRLQTLDKGYTRFTADNPETDVSKFYVRRLVLSGAVRSVMVGRKRLIDWDSLEEYLNGETPATVAAEPRAGTIRRIVV